MNLNDDAFNIEYANKIEKIDFGIRFKIAINLLEKTDLSVDEIIDIVEIKDESEKSFIKTVIKNKKDGIKLVEKHGGYTMETITNTY